MNLELLGEFCDLFNWKQIRIVFFKNPLAKIIPRNLMVLWIAYRWQWHALLTNTEPCWLSAATMDELLFGIFWLAALLK